jgi:hypothetical protein
MSNAPYVRLRVEESRTEIRTTAVPTAPDPLTVLRRELTALRGKYTQLESDARRAFKERDEMKAALDSHDAAGYFRRMARQAIGREAQLRNQITTEKQRALEFGETLSAQRQTIERTRVGLWDLWSGLEDGPVKTRLWEVWSELA